MKRMLVKAFVVIVFGLMAVGVSGTAYAKALVPFKATDTGAATVVGGSGTVIRTADTGSGHASHLGRFTLEAGETIDLATGTITNGFYTMTAANGDSVTGTYSGQALPGLTGYEVSGPVTGGTGRFASATGFLVWHGTLDPIALTFSDKICGTISTKR
jgi:hypothetical protein